MEIAVKNILIYSLFAGLAIQVEQHADAADHKCRWPDQNQVFGRIRAGKTFFCLTSIGYSSH
ncbi:MAG: hypothetical protein RBR69_02380 [Candidatus Cloacimonadaceae bacterium]|nr:hypothetical protein [Candidatus Cloacimonadota bacterium]MDD3533619.1 hypothetical protein [Candidatus Cloacimonadota bacterium]MDY0126965.1 hypothetical protein [Candidatus Cloacimonadaceae bacterium]